MFEKIVVPLDGSALAEAALPAAMEIAARFNSQVLLVRVIASAAIRLAQMTPIIDSPAAAPANVELVQRMLEEERKEANGYLQGVKSRFSGNIETVVVEGEAEEAIVLLANQRGAGLIAMSSHGRGGLARLVFGSVADRVLKESPVPVLLVRIKDDG